MAEHNHLSVIMAIVVSNWNLPSFLEILFNHAPMIVALSLDGHAILHG
jgi:hypothetical protein